MKSMDNWISIDDETPSDNQQCKVKFDDKTESTGKYWADFDIFAITGPMPPTNPQAITHWKPE